MIDASPAEITVKCRIGVDDQDPAVALPRFLEAISQVGIRRVIIHARKAWLQGLSPKDNREIPPLDYELVFAMKAAFPHLHLSINGGVTSVSQARDLLGQGLDGVMIGRAAYQRPADILLEADQMIFGAPPRAASAMTALDRMRPYIAREVAQGTKLASITRHMLGLFAGQPGARAWRRVLSENAHRRDADLSVLDAAVAAMAESAEQLAE
jgi:tRNA-dihydrouridine synthase A